MTVHLFQEKGFTIKEKSQLFSLDGTTEPFPLLARIVLMVDLLFIVSNKKNHLVIVVSLLNMSDSDCTNFIIVLIQILLPLFYVSRTTQNMYMYVL